MIFPLQFQDHLCLGWVLALSFQCMASSLGLSDSLTGQIYDFGLVSTIVCKLQVLQIQSERGRREKGSEEEEERKRKGKSR